MAKTFTQLDFSGLKDIKFVGDGTYLEFKDKYVEIRPSGTDAKTKAYSAGLRKDKILELIKTNPSIKTTQLAEALGVSLRTIKSLIKALEQNKRIERINGKRYGYWKIL